MKDYFYFAIAIHGILMFMAWGILLPIGAYIARYCRQYFGIKWFVYHRNIMISAAICTLTGATLGIIACESHFNKIHKIFGPILNALLIFQGILGYVIHAIGNASFRTASNNGLEEPSSNQDGDNPNERRVRERKWYRQIHRYLGPILMLGGFANMMIGLEDHPKMMPIFPILLMLHMIVILTIFGIAEYGLWNKNESN